MERRLHRVAKYYFIFIGVVAFLAMAAAVIWFAADAAARRSAPQYLLKDTGGHLALYAADGGGPLAEYDIYTRLLPEQDILTLQQGLPVQSEAELQQKLEDYGL